MYDFKLIDFDHIYTEDGLGDGEYFTTISFNNDKEITIDTNGWSEIKTVLENVKFYQKDRIKIEKIDKEIENEI